MNLFIRLSIHGFNTLSLNQRIISLKNVVFRFSGKREFRCDFPSITNSLICEESSKREDNWSINKLNNQSSWLISHFRSCIHLPCAKILMAGLRMNNYTIFWAIFWTWEIYLCNGSNIGLFLVGLMNTMIIWLFSED